MDDHTQRHREVADSADRQGAGDPEVDSLGHQGARAAFAAIVSELQSRSAGGPAYIAVTEPATWEHASYLAAADIVELGIATFDPSNVGSIAKVCDTYERVFASEGTFGGWVLLAVTAMDALEQGSVVGLWEPVKLEEIVVLIARKQHDYGHNNVERFGVPGLLVRVHDKVARLRNLSARQLAQLVEENGLPLPPVAPERNESMQDTLIDVVGYSIVALMVIEGQFTLPLAADLTAGAA